MDGLQKTVAEGLRRLAQKVEDGVYGKDDDAFQDNDNDDKLANAFLSDMHDFVIDMME